MKLFTAEQVRLAMSISFVIGYDIDIKQVINSLESIELPSDEEIEDEIEDSSYSIEYDYGFRIGAKWVIERIKQQAKP